MCVKERESEWIRVDKNVIALSSPRRFTPINLPVTLRRDCDRCELTSFPNIRRSDLFTSPVNCSFLPRLRRVPPLLFLLLLLVPLIHLPCDYRSVRSVRELSFSNATRSCWRFPLAVAGFAVAHGRKEAGDARAMEKGPLRAGSRIHRYARRASLLAFRAAFPHTHVCTSTFRFVHSRDVEPRETEAGRERRRTSCDG